MQAISDISDIINVLVSGTNGVVANTATMGLWYLVDMILGRAVPMLQGMLPAELLNPLAQYAGLYFKLYIFHHIALK